MIVPIPLLFILLVLASLSITSIITYLMRKDDIVIVKRTEPVRSIVDEDLLMEDRLRG